MARSSVRESILVVDDAPDTLEVLQRNLVSRGYLVFAATSVPEAIRLLNAQSVDLVITDLKMPKVSGLDLIKHIRENLKSTETMVITGYPSIEGAVEAVKTGAQEYLTKPFTDEELFAAAARALEKLSLRKAGEAQAGDAPPGAYGFIGDSPVMREVLRTIPKAAVTAATVLITGESGTGKELLARAIHYRSPRARAPFVPINCGAIPDGLIESELFGHVRGAFTGATETRAGFFQTADGGTLFLDEISDISSSMQAKLLRVLQEREVSMVGTTRTKKVDVRIIAATNKDLKDLVEKGAFREDLFFRLNVITIDVPPLRERGEDILPLARHFARKFAKELANPPLRFTDEALQDLRNHHWPGNIRELENVIARLVVMTEENLVEAPDLPSHMRFSALHGRGLHRTLAEVESEYIRHVLASVHNNKTRAAEILGIDRKTLREKLTKPEKEKK